MTHERRPIPCCACGVDLGAAHEYAYVLLRTTWLLATHDRRGEWIPTRYLCIGCVEARIGRRLTAADFDWDVPLTYMRLFQRSDRLLDRLTRSAV